VSSTARIVIVGGGVIGTMLAYAADRRGCEVVQLEREAAARGASVRNFGLVWVSGRRPGDELVFALRSRQLWEELAADVPDVGFRANGSLTIVQEDAELAVLDEVVARDDAPARGFELLDADGVRTANPAVRGEVLAGLLCTTDAAVEPRRVPGAVRARLASSPRYTWLPETHAVEVAATFARDHRGVEHCGDLVLVCVGAAYRSVLGAGGDSAPLRRVRLQMLETEPYPEHVATSLADGDSLRYYPAFAGDALGGLRAPSPLVAEHRLQLLLQQRLDGGLTIGDTHAYDEPFDVGVDEAPYAHLLGRAESILGSRLPPVRRRWAGVYAQAIDDRLFQLEQVADGCHVVNGAGGRGMTLSPAIAERVLDELGVGAVQSATASSTGR
jgi:FAD dependent oxidoreductase TIGR03364